MRFYTKRFLVLKMFLFGLFPTQPLVLGQQGPCITEFRTRMSRLDEEIDIMFEDLLELYEEVREEKELEIGNETFLLIIVNLLTFLSYPFLYLHESYLHTIDAPHVVDQIGLAVYDAGFSYELLAEIPSPAHCAEVSEVLAHCELPRDQDYFLESDEFILCLAESFSCVESKILGIISNLRIKKR
ncbi:uncharacterized protein LOC111714363 [Eurytemora carolleeae]|uniref:uncharacterized protein LOC111714363 n=1 Tax=Eurytemora carolleeae TaxID=1294199 RepID=UPI000C7895FA|nr:uncharacterized protein LOC111714363 [Eurytemora carolleeae]|eukprot:XP_023345223.1 uncharacterized protein LOC111714363 [Eurytemora affinis]